MSEIEMLRSELKLVRDSGKETAVMLDMCKKENEEVISTLSQLHDERMEREEKNKELINALSQEHDKRMEREEENKRLDELIQNLHEEITDLEGRLDIADPKWREYRHIDIGYPRIQDISHSDTMGSNAANAEEISDLSKLNLNGGKSKKKSTKKKYSKQQKTKRRRKNKKN